MALYCLSFVLGCAGSLFWSAILVAVPDFAKSDQQLDRINRIIQTVCNLDYIAGPLLGGYCIVSQTDKKGSLHSPPWFSAQP
ncbi:hypothetical protein GCM10023260_02920 [Bartonella acomydis]|uniref:Uncharacterized protein n=1 Tax=Bartonella acomydis TaxID=686234 RepID=A0ABP9MDH7_9HYPH